MLRNDITEIKLDFNTRINELERDNSELLNTLRSSKKLADMQMKENKSILSTYRDHKSSSIKEIRILKKEIELLEREHEKVLDKNKDLKSRLNKLDKIVYGGKKSKPSFR